MIVELNYALESYTWNKALLWGNFKEHCIKATQTKGCNRNGHILIAAMEILPFIGQVASLFEKIIVDKIEFNNTKLAAIKIQNFHRMCWAKKKFHKKKEAIIKIQSLFRMRAAKMALKEKIAAIKMQTIRRMSAAKMEFDAKKEAVIKIQRLFRTKKELDRQVTAAIKIQSAFRMYTTKKWVMRWLPYAQFRKLLEQETQPFYFSDSLGRKKSEIIGYFGNGGCKKALKIEDNRTLIIPNRMSETFGVWPRIVKEEVAISAFLTKIGILNPRSEAVEISVSEKAGKSLPAYLCQSFENLAKTENCFVIDHKNSESSTWKTGEHFLFETDEDRYKEENWIPLMEPLISDIEKLLSYKFYLNSDFNNVAIVKKPQTNKKSQYEIRFFGFDYSAKHCPTNLPNGKQYPVKDKIDKACEVFVDTIFSILYREFDIIKKGRGGKEYEFINKLLELGSQKIREKFSNSTLN